MTYSINTTTYRSPNNDNRPQGAVVNSLVIHTTEGSFDSDARWLCNPSSGVSCHYVLPPAGSVIYQLVPDSRRAWHAGESSYQGRSDWNNFSLGIEISHLKGQMWAAGQQNLTAELCRDLIGRYHIPQSNVVAHRWIATPAGRKIDPTDWSDPDFTAWIAGLYAPVYRRYEIVAPCAAFTARAPDAPLASGPTDNQTRLSPGTIVNVGDVTAGWLWISPNVTDPPGIGFIPLSYARPT